MTGPEAVGLSSERLDRVRPVLEKHIGETKMAGAVTLIARRGEVVHEECVGWMDREQGKPISANTIFRVYSMTKPKAGICSKKPLSEFVADLLQMPLAFQPGTAFRYSYAHDVVAHLIEVISGRPLDVYLRENLFKPRSSVVTQGELCKTPHSAF